MHIQDLAGVAHDDIDPSVFSISGDEQKVRCPYKIYFRVILWLQFNDTCMQKSILWLVLILNMLCV